MTRYREALAEHDCEDALPLRLGGQQLRLEFRRVGDSAHTVIAAAICAVRRALRDALILEVGPDFLPLGDIANLVNLPAGCLEELQRELFAGFPARAVLRNGLPLWRAAEVMRWIEAVGGIDINAASLETALEASSINDASQARRIGRVA